MRALSHLSGAGSLALHKVLALVLLLVQALAAAPAGAKLDAVKRGEYVFRAAGCAACHTQPGGKGKPLAGGRALDTPFGVFYSPNVTPHPTHGIGGWSADDLWRALTRGEGPGGVHYYPVFPYDSYSAMRREDSDALHAYMMSVPAADAPNRAHDIPWYMRWRFANRVWKWLFLQAGTFTPVVGKSEAWNRGAYLVRVLGHCGECHTPRNFAGALKRDRHLAGNPQGPEGKPVPSIRSDGEEGLRKWSVNEIATYLKSGEDPDFDFAGGSMVEVIEEGTSHLSEDDRMAIARYLKDLPAL